jgi:hypothetical protein
MEYAQVQIDGEGYRAVTSLDELKDMTEGITFGECNPSDIRIAWAYTHGVLPDGRSISIGTHKESREMDAWNCDLGMRLHKAWKAESGIIFGTEHYVVKETQITVEQYDGKMVNLNRQGIFDRETGEQVAEEMWPVPACQKAKAIEDARS